MDTVEVEPVERIEDADVPIGVDAPEYVLYGGKGGVGKTTMAAATALASARDGVETLVVSTDPAHSLADTLDADVGSEPTRVGDDPLYAAEIDPDRALEDAGEFGLDEGALGGFEDLLGEDSPMDPLGGTMPGADEAAAMRQLLVYMDDDRFERVVIDTAPTGHTLRLLQLPEVMDSMVGKLLTFRERLGGMMENVKGMFGGDSGDAEEGLQNLEVLRDRIERLRAVLQDPARTDFRLVMVPEEMSVVESKRLLARLEEFHIPVGTVVVNRVMEDLRDVIDVDAEWYVPPDTEHCAFCANRWKVQQKALASAQDLFRGHDVKRVPLFSDEVRGREMLRVVAACLD